MSNTSDTNGTDQFTKSDIYCHGLLLETVQMSGLFEDSKTFVDMPLKYTPGEVLEKFNKLFKETSTSPSKDKLKQFVQDNFYEAGEELDQYLPPDWAEQPSILQKIKDNDLTKWAQELNSLWKVLGRQMKDHVESAADLTSLIHIPYPFIVPGDRFREFYYWDSYWVISGLLLCDMIKTSKGMIQNFITLIERYGMIPNGGRIYYLTRSQPPLLIPMVNKYYEKTKDINFIQQNIQSLEKEYNFWIQNRSIKVLKSGISHTLAHYKAGSHTPRPEGYKEDRDLAQGLDNDSSAELYKNIASACESGWDFSSRWFKDYTNMSTICTQDIVPVDLNCILGLNEQLLAKFFSILGNEDKSQFYTKQFQSRLQSIEAVMWNEDHGSWFDVDVTDGSHRQAFYVSNFLPMFTGMVSEDRKEDIVKKCLAYIEKNGITSYPGGIPNSLNTMTSQQWDFPNAWPPSVHMFIEGLDNTGVPEATELARNVTQTWIASNYESWRKQKVMLEKYSVTHKGGAGGGGEYSIQTGFGWTNGVIFMLLDKYGDVLTA